MAMTCTSLPMRRVAFQQKHITWPSVAWRLLAPNRLRGLAWPENCSVIGRAQRGSERSLRSCSTMQALLVLYSHGRCSFCVPAKLRAHRTSEQTRLNLVCFRESRVLQGDRSYAYIENLSAAIRR